MRSCGMCQHHREGDNLRSRPHSGAHSSTLAEVDDLPACSSAPRILTASLICRSDFRIGGRFYNHCFPSVVQPQGYEGKEDRYFDKLQYGLSRDFYPLYQLAERQQRYYRLTLGPARPSSSRSHTARRGRLPTHKRLPVEWSSPPHRPHSRASRQSPEFRGKWY